MVLKPVNQTFKFTQKQFDYTQIQKTNEEIKKRFQEGIKLLENENESVRLSGIYILCNIVQEVVNKPAEGKHLESENNTNNNQIKINIDEKYPSLHTQILNILCAHIRTQTNSEKYLKQYYPSIYQVRHSKQFKESFGEKGENNHLSPVDEKPSNEVQTLLDLLTKSNDKNNTPNYTIEFTLNFEKAILNGADCNGAYFEGANCRGAHFKRAQLFGAHFKWADCEAAHFEEADCEAAHFEGADCKHAHFEGACCKLAHFEEADCKHAHFEGACCEAAHFEGACCKVAHFEEAYCGLAHFEEADCEAAYFNGAHIDRATFSANEIVDCQFDGINHDLGECGVLSDNNTSIILVNIEQKNMPNKIAVTDENKDCLAEYCYCASLKMDTPWRISITEVKRYIDVDLFHDNEKISNCLIAFQAAYEAHNNDKDLFFASLNLEDQKWACYYLNDFDQHTSIYRKKKLWMTLRAYLKSLSHKWKSRSLNNQPS